MVWSPELPVDEIDVLLDIDAEQLRFDLRVLHDHEFPGLAIGARHRPAANLEDLVDVFVGNRIRLELADTDAIAHKLQKLS
jgi:hypothetical protein